MLPALRFNAAKNGVELRFPSEPPRTILDALHSHSWHWSRRQRIWYHAHTPEAEAFARALCAGEPVSPGIRVTNTHAAATAAHIERREPATVGHDDRVADEWCRQTYGQEFDPR